MTPLEVVALVLQIVLKAMDGQPADVREAMWRRHMENLAQWDEFWKKVGSGQAIVPQVPSPARQRRTRRK